MERFGPKENVMSREKNETYILTGFLCSISEVLSMFGLDYGWRHVIMYAG